MNDMSANEAECDRSALDEMREGLGDELFRQLVGSCVLDVTTFLDQLPTRYAPDREKMARFIAHKLSGLFGQFGAMEAWKAAHEVETCEAEMIEGHLSRLRYAGTRALAELERIRDGSNC